MLSLAGLTLGSLAPASPAAAPKPTCPSSSLVKSVLGAKVAAARSRTGFESSTNGTPDMQSVATCPYGAVEIVFSSEPPTAMGLKEVEGDVREDYPGIKAVSGLGGGAFSVALGGGSAPYLFVLANGKAIFEIEGSGQILNASNEIALARKLLALKTL